ncbi:DNA mismatch repair endonuclease MutL [Calycomorphotria hydatis]|uniref:DNA mismatch repair protein MutL n=1 Tax=Calycomorphotria hydatis TaxID=2528027 RepID=A0A517TAB9_9PLAN|nr:DNA mismatch repair endonuclease MutL [Calycomorphotria hydatis]QDT65317.1 DNA mismatch repair protein MutL [Calycomorphotria hydatis]
MEFTQTEGIVAEAEGETRIRQLPPDVINKIAAGEVIERPASVVKELLENSLDALSTRIDLDISRGGTERICVTDDGEGIAAEQLPLAIASHATSKLVTAEDLFRVQTMGFRGEALASISAVSQFRLRSRQASSELGAELVVEGGFPQPIKPVGCPAGTRIEVRNLFCNTPVRRKFLKTVSTEFGHIAEQFTRIALGQPRLSMTLTHDERTVFDLPAVDSLLDRLELFFGSGTTAKMIPVESEVGDVRLWGYVGHPEVNRSSRKAQYLFLNGRWIQDRSLQHALSEAYRGLIMVGRHPMAFLFLEMPSEMADVNVHPTKAEVRFADSSALYRQLLSTLRTKFLGMDLSGTMNLADRQKQGDDPAQLAERQHEQQRDLRDWANQALSDWKPAPASGLPPLPTVTQQNEPTSQANSTQFEPNTSQPEADSTVTPEPSSDTLQTAPRVMQVMDTYIVAETAQGLTLIDQHALHERVMYEYLRERVLNGAVETQRLLVPETLELSPRSVAIALEYRDLFEQVGYPIEEFGGNTILLSGYPALMSRSNYGAIFRDLLEHLGDTEGNPSRRDSIDALLHMMSCKAAIKAGQRLSDDEMQTLLAKRHLIDDAHHCPHGRPTALVLSREELDRQFGRLG